MVTQLIIEFLEFNGISWSDSQQPAIGFGTFSQINTAHASRSVIRY